MSRNGVANESKIIEYLSNNDNITSKVAAQLLKLSKFQANKILNKMIEKDIIKKLGKSVSTYYILI